MVGLILQLLRSILLHLKLLLSVIEIHTRKIDVQSSIKLTHLDPYDTPASNNDHDHDHEH